jgi:hypothetical protein
MKESPTLKFRWSYLKSQWEYKRSDEDVWREDKQKQAKCERLTLSSLAAILPSATYKSITGIGKHFGVSPTNINRKINAMAEKLVRAKMGIGKKEELGDEGVELVKRTQEALRNNRTRLTDHEALQLRIQEDEVWTGDTLLANMGIKFL